MTSSTVKLSVMGQYLQDIILDEFARIPIRNWGHFFPVFVATSVFISATRAGFLGETAEIRYKVGSPPEFRGKNAQWFAENLVGNNEYLDLVEPLWYQVAERITPVIRDRGVMLKAEMPILEPSKIERLSQLVLEKVDFALRFEDGTK
ncbi:MAG: hypothetical protein KF716_10515 [Anaerolineae bacterium]|nr:hypothetical protein [Anaerolineae bacterium]